MKNQAVDITQFFLKDGTSVNGSKDLHYKALPMSLKAEEHDDGSVTIRGWASTKDKDLADDIIEPGAFKSSLKQFLKRGTMLFMHDWYALPVGKWDVGIIKDRGLWVEGRIANTRVGRDIQELIELETLDSLSVGFRLKKSSTDEESRKRRITDLFLHEASIVNAGMNPRALFSQAKSLNLDIDNLYTTSPDGEGRGSNRKGSAMTEISQETLDLIKSTEKLVGEHQDALEKATGEAEGLSTDIRNQGEMLTAIKEKHSEMEKGHLPKAEFDTFVKKLGADILDIQEKVKKRIAVDQTRAQQLPLTDWRMLQTKDGVPLVTRMDDHGRPLNILEQKAWQLFECPVKYEGDAGLALKNLRDLYQTALIVGAVYRGRFGGSFNCMQLKTFKLLHEWLEVYDGGKYADVAKAMYSTGTGVGDEWVPTFMSSQLYDLYRLTPSLESMIPAFEMPTNPYTWPIKTSGATMYRAAEAAVANPDQLTQSNIGTSNITFTAETFATVVATSPQLIEDSIIPIVQEINAELAFEMRSRYESMLINGDNTATHRDTGKSYTSVNAESYEDGLRYIATDDSKKFHAQSTTAGEGDGASAFTAKDLRAARKEMGKMGQNPADCVYVTNVDVWYKILSMDQFAKPGDYGAGNTWASGTLQMIDGCQLYLSEHMSNVENILGPVTNTSTGAYSSFLCFNKTAFKIGSKRGVEVEFEKDIKTQQFAFVSTMRKSFKKMTASTLSPVAMGHGVTTAGV